MPPTALDRIRDGLAAAADGSAVAVGWATVDLDRAAAELAGALGLLPDVFVPADDSIVLGAACRVATGVLPDGRSLAILEPITEGRLAGTLARLGEGPVAVWMARDGPARTNASSARSGPFGPERLLSGGPLQGPYRLLIETEAGTIRP